MSAHKQPKLRQVATVTIDAQFEDALNDYQHTKMALRAQVCGEQRKRLQSEHQAACERLASATYHHIAKSLFNDQSQHEQQRTMLTHAWRLGFLASGQGANGENIGRYGEHSENQCLMEVEQILKGEAPEPPSLAMLSGNVADWRSENLESSTHE